MKQLSQPKFFRTLNYLLLLTGLTFITTWLPFLRAILDGETYQWGTRFFGTMYRGAGVSTDFIYIVLNALVGIALLTSFYWAKNRIIFYILCLLWFVPMIGNSFYEVFVGEGYSFHGDTLNLHLDLSYVIIPFMLLLGAFVIYMILQDRKQQFRAKWSKKNKRWLAILLIPLPVQAVLLYMGEPHGITDKIGVIIAVLQVILISFALRGYQFENS